MKKEKIIALWNRKGYSYAIEGKYKEAIKCFNKTLETDSNNKIALLNKGNALSILKRPSDADRCVNKLLLNNPKDLDALVLKSIILRDLGEPEKGLTIINDVLRNFPEDFYALANKAMLLSEMGNHQEALEISNKILTHKPDHIQTLVIKAAALAKLKQFNEALEVYEAIFNQDPNNVYSLVNKGILHSNMGDSNKAIELYNKALELEPNNPVILGNKGNDLDTIGKTNEALLNYNKALERDPENDFVLLNKAAILNNTEKFTESLKLLKKLKSLHPKYPHTFTHLGIANLNLINFQIALKNFLKAKDLISPSSSEMVKIIDDYIKITENFIGLEEKLIPFDEKFLNLVQGEKWLELKDYNKIFITQFETVIDRYDIDKFPIKFVELLRAKKYILELVDRIFNFENFSNKKFENIRNIFQKYNLEDYVYLVNNIENFYLDIKTHGSLEEFLKVKKDLLVNQLRDLSSIDGSLTEIIFRSLNFSITKRGMDSKQYLRPISHLEIEMKEINILHISDLHFGIENLEGISEADLNKRRTTLFKFKVNFKNFLKYNPEWKPDIIAITGDIGYAGKEQDYKLAQKWLEDLISALKLKPKNLIICPGNHDRNILGLERDYPKSIEESDQYWYKFKEEKNDVRFNDFINFSKKFLTPLYLDGKDQYLAGTRIINGIRFLVLNSARYAFGGDDKGKIFLGWPDVNLFEIENFLVDQDKFDSSIVTFLLFHHPREWFHDQTINEFKSHAATYNFLSSRCHIILNGHIHAEKIGEPLRIGKGAQIFSIGAIYLRQSYINNCAILKVKPNLRKVTRLIIEFDPSELEWKPNFEKVKSYGFGKKLILSQNNILAKKFKDLYDRLASKDPDHVIIDVRTLVEEIGKTNFGKILRMEYDTEGEERIMLKELSEWNLSIRKGSVQHLLLIRYVNGDSQIYNFKKPYENEDILNEFLTLVRGRCEEHGIYLN
jgi:tetratricopeptide (TPR) repeat protein/predicted MPP superfamily phosphohydrolase